MALRVDQLEELQRLLRRASALTDRYERRLPDFADAVIEWLRDLEAALEKNRSHVVALVAHHRASLLAEGRGVSDPAASSTGGRSRRKRLEATAIRGVREVSTAVTAAIAPRVNEVAEAEKVARQALAIAALKRSLQPCLQQPGHRQRLECIRAVIRADADLLPYYAALTGLVSGQDALVLLDRAVPELDVED